MTNDIRDIKGLVPLPMGQWWLWLLIALVVLSVVAWLMLRKKKKVPATQGPPPSPYDLAIEAFRRLLDENLMEKALVDEFYTRLSDIVRHYLEGRFQLRAPELTTEEFLFEVSRTDSLAQEHKDLLGAFLQECDLVKFAKLRPATTDMQRAFEAAEKFVQDTRPRLRAVAVAS